MSRFAWFFIGWLSCTLWLTCSYEPEPRISPEAAYRLALDQGVIDGLDARP